MIRSRLLLCALLAVAAAASAGPPYALQRISDAAVVTRTYTGAPYLIPGYRWLEVRPAPRPQIDERLLARLPCSTVPPAERIDSADPAVIDCLDTAGADELVRLLAPAPTDGAAVAGTLHTDAVQVGWQDTGAEPVQALAVLAQTAIAQAAACTARAASPTACAGMDGLLARRDRAYPISLADETRITRCAAASAACDSPCEANRVRLAGLVRAAYAARQAPAAERPPLPPYDNGWPEVDPLPSAAAP